MTQKIKAVLANMLRSSGNTTNIDRFRESIGSWQKVDNVSTQQITYVKNDNKPYNISALDPSFQINYFVVPTTGNMAIPFIEQIYRKQTYRIERLDGSYPAPESLIPFGYRFTNFAMEDSVRSVPGLDPMVSIKQSDVQPGISSTRIDFIYKTENIQYEDLASTNVSQEKSLPNYYDITLWNRDISPNNDLYSFLRDSLTKYSADPLKGASKTNIVIPCDNMSLINEGNSYITEEKPNIFSSHEVLDGVATRENTFSQIPYYVDIRVSEDTQNSNPSIGTSGQKENKKFIRNNIMFFPKETITSLDLQDEKTYDNNYDLSALLSRWHLQNKNIINLKDNITYKFDTLPVTTSEFYTYDLITWLNQYAPSVVGLLPPNMSFIGIEETACSRMIQPTQTKMVLVQYALKKILNAFSRIDVENEEGTYQNFLPQLYSAKEMIECGGLGSSETLFYKIEKFIGQGTNTTPIQTIIIPHSDFGTRYIDTQVSYDYLYTYRVSEVKAVMYCEYEYRLSESSRTMNDDMYLVDIYQYPRIKIIEIPISTRSGRILANPPNIPQIKVLPTRKSKDKFRILFQNVYGSSMGDTNKILLANNQTSCLELLNRETSQRPMILLDDKVGIHRFHIFYTTEDDVSKAVTHQDLLNKQLYSVSTNEADSATIKMSLRPNKKYYLSFVSLNRLGLASPGTEIYEFKLVSDSGLTYLDFKPYVYDMDKEIYKDSKTAQKLISISPSGLQGLLDFIAPEPGEVTIDSKTPNSKGKPVSFGNQLEDKLFAKAGIGEGKVLGKKIKVRIKSKHTNQTFDINLHFKHERVESTFDKTRQSTTLLEEPIENPNTGTDEITMLNNGYISLSNGITGYACGRDSYNFTDFYYPEKPKDDPRPESTITYIPDTGYPDVSYPDPSTPLPTPPGISGVYPPTQGNNLLFDPNDPSQRVSLESSTDASTSNQGLNNPLNR